MLFATSITGLIAGLIAEMNTDSRPFSRNILHLFVATLVLFSGMAALTHQLLWTRRLFDLLGASTESSARVFATFFLGLSCGSALAAFLVGRVRNPIRIAGWVQVSVPVLVTPILFLPTLTDWIWPWIGVWSTDGFVGRAAKTGLTLAFVFPPSMLMGISFPLIVAGVLRRHQRSVGRFGIVLYAVNTLGGALGILLTVVLTLPALGYFWTMVAAAIVDGLVGVMLLCFGSAFTVASPTPVQDSESRSVSARDRRLFARMICLAFVSGMGVLALEVVAFQMFQLVATISLFSPAAVLFCAITSLAVSAAIFARFEKFFIGQARRRNIAVVLAVSGVLVILAPQVFMMISRQSNWFAATNGVFDFALKLGALSLLSVGPAWLVSGLIFPFAVACAGKDCSPVRSGQRLGGLLAINGLGGLVGAEVTYQVLLPIFGVYGTMTVIGLGFATSALMTSLHGQETDRIIAGTFASIAIVVGVVVGRENASLPVFNPTPGVHLVDFQSGRQGTVAVIENENGDRSILVSNQYLLGGTAVRYDQERQVLLPLVLHKKPTRVGCIGLATGITPGAALTLESVDEVTAIELSPLVAKAAEAHFSDFNHRVCFDARASVVIGDGRTVIASKADYFDVVTGDLFLPWAPGTARLYSKEHFAAVRRSLRPGGIFCQWLPMYQLTHDQFQMIVDTFVSEFGDAELFVNHFRVISPMLALVGGKEPGGLNWKQVSQRCDALRVQNAIADPVLRHLPGIQMLYLGSYPATQSRGPRVTLADPYLEYAAATVRLSANPASEYIHSASWVRFCRERLRIATDQVSPNDAQLMALASGLMELDHARRTHNRLAIPIELQLSRLIPNCFMNDPSAEMKRWPGPVITTDAMEKDLVAPDMRLQ